MSCCTLYIDDSGVPDWPPPAGKSKNTFHTMGGIILEPKADLDARKKTEWILSKYIPADTKRLFSKSRYELHFDEIRSGRGICRKIDPVERVKMIDEVFDLLLELNPVAIASTVNKSNARKFFGERAIPPKTYAMRSVIHKFAMYLNRHDKIGSVVYDYDRSNFNEAMHEELVKFREDGIQLGSEMPVEKLDRILNNVNFCPSYPSPGIQLADFVASAVWQKHERGDLGFYNKIEALWESDNGRIYYDSLIP